MNEKQNDGANSWQDPDDAPELTDEFFARATLHDGKRVVRRGRPKVPSPKAQVTLRLDAAVLSDLRATGPGWQSRANEVLKDWLAAQHHPHAVRQRPE
jgi:uncharacterized protein (DUF4415 family)